MASEGVGTAPGQSAEVQLVSLLALFEELAYHNVVPNLLGPSMYPCTMESRTRQELDAGAAGFGVLPGQPPSEGAVWCSWRVPVQHRCFCHHGTEHPSTNIPRLQAVRDSSNLHTSTL